MVECQCHLVIAVLKWYSPGVMKEKAQRIYTLSDSVNLSFIKDAQKFVSKFTCFKLLIALLVFTM